VIEIDEFNGSQIPGSRTEPTYDRAKPSWVGHRGIEVRTELVETVETEPTIRKTRPRMNVITESGMRIQTRVRESIRVEFCERRGSVSIEKVNGMRHFE
jgi:hypothetical protein